MSGEFRGLHRRVELGMTDRPELAAKGEPEAVPAWYEEMQAKEARDRDRTRERAEWRVCRGRVEAELAAIAQRPNGRLVREEVRLVRRLLQTMERRLLT